ncbi:MAG: hypothetical protein H7X92_04745 [Chitinophagales bacterium]|nr:hypothetical protein [Hyphomicrobiales bacterium]
MRDTTVGEFSGIVQQIYDCALDPSRWDGTLDAIKAMFKADNAILGLADVQRQQFLLSKNTGMEPDWMVTQAPYFEEQATVMERILTEWPSLDEPVTISRIMSAEERAASPFLSEWAGPRGLVDVISLIIMHTPDRVARVDMGFHKDHGLASDHQIELGRLLVPHLRRAAMISNVLDVRTIERNRMAETLELIRYGVILADENGKVLHANAAAEGMLRSADLVKATGGTLLAVRSSAARELHTAIRLAARSETELGKTGLAITLTPPDAAPCVAHVLPLGRGEYRTGLQPSAAAAIFIGKAADLQASAAAIAVAYDLTASEKKILAELLAGRTLAEAAKGLNVSINTARTHLSNIFAKTDVSRQADLIRLAAQIEKFVSSPS